MYKRLQEYNTSLQQYNTKLQTELSMANETLKRVETEKAAFVENLSTLRGQYSSLHDQLTSSRVSLYIFCLFIFLRRISIWKTLLFLAPFAFSKGCCMIIIKTFRAGYVVIQKVFR